MRARLGALIAAFGECFVPQFCALCGGKVSTEKAVCAECESLLVPHRLSFCPLCRFAEAGESVAIVCHHQDIVAGTAALRCGPSILTLIHRFKYSGEREIGAFLALLIIRAGIVDDSFKAHHVMCPVPLFPARERERGFNQSEEIARHLEASSGVPLLRDLLVRVRPTKEQARLPAAVRRRNLPGSFATPKPSVAKGKNVVLVDDVLTTGSTAAACVETLLRAGARRVLVVTVIA